MSSKAYDVQHEHDLYTKAMLLPKFRRTASILKSYVLVYVVVQLSLFTHLNFKFSDATICSTVHRAMTQIFKFAHQDETDVNQGIIAYTR